MPNSVRIPWGAWYASPEEISLEFPANWDVKIFPIRDTPDMTAPAIIDTALAHPVGTPPLRTLASGKATAALVVEDISRPTPCESICNAILRELNAGGIPDSSVTLIGALGAHRPMTRADYVKKVGAGVVERVNVENHNPYENLVPAGSSKKGTPIFVNKTYHAAALKITVGTVLPHPLAGFGGGAKVILPGLCGIDTLAANHQAGVRGVGIGLGFVTDLRRDIEDVCARVGLDFSVNIIGTSKRGIAGVHAGHYINAHRAAIEQAMQVYHTDLPRLPPKDRFNVGFFNLYPEDTELSQALKGINSLLGALPIFTRKSAVVFMTAATEGRGFHSLQGETGAKLYQNWGENPLFQTTLASRPFGIFSPNVSRADVDHFYPRETLFAREFKTLLAELEPKLGAPPKAAIFPTSLALF